MLARDYDPFHLELPTLVQWKLNGVRLFVSPDGLAYTARNGRRRPALDGLFGRPGVWLDGECTGTDNMPLQTIAGLVNTDERTEEHKKLTFRPFDIVSNEPQEKRLETLASVARETGLASVPYTILASFERVANNYALATSIDLEGVVYRNMFAPYYQGQRTWALMKRKRLFTEEVLVVRVIEGKGKFAGMLGAFAVVTADGASRFSCGSGHLTVESRKAFWADPPIGRWITIEYPYKSIQGIPLQAQFVSIREPFV